MQAQNPTTTSPSLTTMGGPLSRARYLKDFDPAAPFHRIAIHVNQNTWNFDSGNLLEIDHMRLEYRR